MSEGATRLRYSCSWIVLWLLMAHLLAQRIMGQRIGARPQSGTVSSIKEEEGGSSKSPFSFSLLVSRPSRHGFVESICFFESGNPYPGCRLLKDKRFHGPSSSFLLLVLPDPRAGSPAGGSSPNPAAEKCDMDIPRQFCEIFRNLCF